MTLELLEQFLNKIYSKETCSPICKDLWGLDNPTLGHCAIVALLVNDFFGGEIYKTTVDGVIHYFNIINDTIVDLTSQQFSNPIDYTDRKKKSREGLLGNPDTSFRYRLLKLQLDLILVDSDIHKCNLCSDKSFLIVKQFL